MDEFTREQMDWLSFPRAIVTTAVINTVTGLNLRVSLICAA